MLDNQQLDYVTLILTALHGNTFAFYVEERGHGGHEIFYALPYTPNGGPTWTSIVVALQHMAGRYTFREGNIPSLYKGSGVVCVNAAEGMRRFFGVNLRERNIGGYNLGNVIPNLQGLLNALPNTTFTVIPPDTLVVRNQLDNFVQLPLGAPPGFGIDFDSRSSHIHRIYMALAFRRARHKYTGQNNEGGHLIAALLVDKRDGSVRALSHNTKNINVSFHAEVNLVQAFLKHFPAERAQPFILYTTLQPCPMCAAMIAEFMPATMVFYGQMDPGGHMQNMVTQPNFNRLMSPRFSDPVEIKPLRGWGTGGGDWDNYQSPNDYNGRHVNQSGKLDWNIHFNDQNGVVVIERHEDIEKVMQHIYPLIQQL